jgi:hypothetical protein
MGQILAWPHIRAVTCYHWNQFKRWAQQTSHLIIFTYINSATRLKNRVTNHDKKKISRRTNGIAQYLDSFWTCPSSGFNKTTPFRNAVIWFERIWTQWSNRPICIVSCLSKDGRRGNFQKAEVLIRSDYGQSQEEYFWTICHNIVKSLLNFS